MARKNPEVFKKIIEKHVDDAYRNDLLEAIDDDRVLSVWTFAYHDLDLKKRIGVGVEYSDHRFEFYTGDRVSEFFNCADEYEHVFLMEKPKEAVCIPEPLLEDLMEYHNAFYYIRDGVVVTGWFIEKVAVVVDGDYSVLSENWSKVSEILKSFRWKRSDPWRGRFASDVDRKKGFVRVLSGWFSNFSMNEQIKKLSMMSKGVIPDFVDEALIIIARSSNVLVSYIDVYVPEKIKEKFLEWLEVKDKEDVYSEGLYLEVKH